eukprot:TRINITY_DN42399_c0_g1_i1.p3 TRINITY_DN42399_c0_g1~~TRINITY_DN42399_c0_g1_i1.p3  ORF type:complete len:134 (-),score=39.47 TRINITY_DN42399_c0_g1_i1:279-680(-)
MALCLKLRPGRSMRCSPRAAAAAALVALVALAAPRGAAAGVTVEEFSKKVVPVVREFVTARYEAYGRGEVTLRHMKQYIVDHGGFGLSYDDLREDAYSAAIEDETDAIVKRCDGGKKPAACVNEAPAAIAGEL